VDFNDMKDCNRPVAALGAYSTCNEYAAVIKRISRQLNTSFTSLPIYADFWQYSFNAAYTPNSPS
jgi:hypothetical protein